MTEKFKKIDRRYVLSDSSVNEYGFRLLTSGYQIEAFRKNPIGYYMHRREEGIALKWEDVAIENDCVVGTPVINLSNTRGEQTCAEAENGFLNAASVGHIVVLEYSTEPQLMLPGQTGPTITKWYNKECSLVDIPGNCNALTALYDAQENALNLMDIGGKVPIIKQLTDSTLPQLCLSLQLPEGSDSQAILAGVQDLVQRSNQLQATNTALQQQIEDLTDERNNTTVIRLLDRALEDKKITVQLRDRLLADYGKNPEGLQALLTALPAYRSITDTLKARQDHSEALWQWDDYEKSDPSGKKLKDLRANNPTRYKELFDAKFGGAAGKI